MTDLNIKEKINLDRNALIENGAVTIVAFGDSVTHGCFGLGEFDYENVYHVLLKKKILELKNYVPINVINSGISGTCASDSLLRMEKQVFSHNPDLIIVAFGLNDINGSLEEYISSLEKIFTECNRRGVETIFMTPNMMCTYTSEETPKEYIETAKRLAGYQTSGRMDEYIDSARKLAYKMGIKVADCYSVWKEMSKTEDTTRLLSNRINHPTREMHKLFADKIFECIFD